MAWLVRDDEVLAAAEVVSTRAARRRGLMGRDGVDGAIVLRPCRQVHTFGVQFPIDVVWCGADGRVLRTATMHRSRVSRPVLGSRFVIEAEAGAVDRWSLRPGDVIEIVDA
ncbi:MAG: DUF192 domain-containing protein [Acidimicrobiia bacterium]